MRLLLATCVLVLTGCFGPPTVLYESVAPDRRATLKLVITKQSLGDADFGLLVESQGKSVQIGGRSDCWMGFAHAAWRGSIVSVFVDGQVCRQFMAAYDTASNTPVNFEATRQWLGESIVKEYQVSPEELSEHGGDVFQWIIDPPYRASEEFQKRAKTQPDRR